MSWQTYAQAYPNGYHSVVGDVRVFRSIQSHGLKLRELMVYLPPSYAKSENSQRRYPVLYMMDGQNVFDDATSYSGEWGADEAAEALAGRANKPLECIIVGVPNGGVTRLEEYVPWHDRRITERFPESGPGGRARDFLSFLLETVKPLVDGEFRTSQARAETGIAGSSAGGLIALWASFAAPAVFGFCGAFSSALWLGRGRMYGFARRNQADGLRVYLDVGHHEGSGPQNQRQYLLANRKMRDILVRHQYDVAYVEDKNGVHSESDWRRRFPPVLEWFLDGETRPS
jgi:predicted alpha/beta superfamily hydrolase